MKLGRPAEFDKEAALDVAMRLFWERGYEGTSMADLSLAMGIHPSSIYAAFGDKQQLFALAAKRYADVPAQYMVKALEQPTLRGFILAAFDNTVEFLSSREHPSSCFTLTGAIACGADTVPAKLLMKEMRLQNEAAIKARLLRARKAGRVSEGRECRRLYAVSLHATQRSGDPDRERINESRTEAHGRARAQTSRR